MTRKKFVILLPAVLLLTLAVFGAGCSNSRPDPPPPGQSSESTGQEANKTDAKSKPEKTKLEYGEITDPVELEKLWQEYLFDSSNLVGISRSFSTAKEIEPLYVARFCWYKYINEHDAENLEPENEHGYLRLFPLETALQYAERYFNLDHLDVSQIDEHSYDPQKKAFLFSPGGKRQQPRPSYKGSLRGKRLEKAMRNSDGTIIVVLAQPDSQVSDRIRYRDTYILKQREGGSLYFVSGKREYINNHLVAISGEYQRFDRIAGFDGDLDALSLLGETEGRMILAYTPYDKAKNAALLLLNPAALDVEKRLEINGHLEPKDVSLKGESIIIRRRDKTLFADKMLEQTEVIPLPRVIWDKIKREPLDNEKNNPVIFFGGYDVSQDRTKYVYADETGLKLYNITDGSDNLLSGTVPIAGSELVDNSFHWAPRFVADEQKVVTTMTGYESARGYTLYDFRSRTQKYYAIGSECSSTGLIRYDTGLMEINNYIRDEQKQDGDYKTLYLNFQNGEVQEIPLEDKGDTGYIVMPDQLYVGSNYAVFITSRQDQTDNAENEHYINRLNLNTMQAEPKIITVKAAEAHLLGVLADGRVVFWYNLNPSEKGICITE
ncbi:MAG: hypothetical protein ACOWWO_08665 [Peptococcaceae bacterium]